MPPEPPDKPAQRCSKSPSIKLEGERRAASSCNVERTSGDTDMSGVLTSIKETGEQPKKLSSTSELEREHLERRDKENSPDRPREEPVDPGSEPVTPGSVHDIQERPRNVGNKRIDGTDAPCQDTGPGWVLEVQGEPKVIKGNPDSEEVVNSAEYDWIGPSNDQNERIDETSAHTTQPIRTPHDTQSSGEGQGMAMSHWEAAGDEVESGDMDDNEAH